MKTKTSVRDAAARERGEVRLVQTRLPLHLYRLVEVAAKSEGLSVAAYLRRLLILRFTRAQ